MSSDEKVSLGELLLEVSDLTIGRLFVKIPATVIAQDPVTLRVTVQPACQAYERDPETDALVPFVLPAVANVPVQYPSGGGINITWPLLPGDSVWLEVADHSLDEWHAGQPEPVFPVSRRRFSLSDAICVPGARKNADPVPATAFAPGALVLEGADIRLGSSAAVDPVVRLSTLLTYLNALKVSFDTHTHISAAPGSPTVIPVPLSPAVPNNLGTTKTKAE